MRERPILFSAPMICAILDGRKTQTRRAVRIVGAWAIEPGRCPYGQPGDRLWVRESWRVYRHHDATSPAKLKPLGQTVMYAAGGSSANSARGWSHDPMWPLGRHPAAGKLRSSIHMPRWASRLLLEITAVRVERLQAISEADAIAEGCSAEGHFSPGGPWGPAEYGGHTARQDYASLWESINGAGSWDTNPWVWALSFRRIGA